MKFKSFLFIVVAGVLWGTSGIFVKFLNPYGFTTQHMTLVRSLVSLLSLGVFLLIKDKKLFKIKPLNLLICICTGIGLYFTVTLYFNSIQLTSMSTSVVLMYSAPVYVMIFSVIFFKEKLSKLKLVAVALMIIGCVLSSGIIGETKFNALGIIYGALSGVAYAGYNVLTKISLRKGTAPLTTLFYTVVTVTVLALCTSDSSVIISVCGDNPSIILLLIALGLATFVLPYFFYTFALNDLSAGTASSLSIIEPMSATLFGIIIFGEQIDFIILTGIILILSSIVLLGCAENKLLKRS